MAELDLVADVPLADLSIVPRPVPDEVGSAGIALLSRVPGRGHHAIALGRAPGDLCGERFAQVAEITLGPAGRAAGTRALTPTTPYWHPRVFDVNEFATIQQPS